MIKSIRAILKKIPGVHRLYSWMRKSLLSTGQREQIFHRIYKNNYWGNNESVSGQGSTLQETAHVREEMSHLLRELGIKQVVDAPCGDFNWMSKVDLQGIRYTGIDIVEELIRDNNKRYGKDDVSFIKSDIVNETVPPCDLILCRDCLVHFSYADISKAIRNFKKSGAKYLLTTSFNNKPQNKDIVTGQWRPLNLEIAPFGSFNIIRTIDERNQTDSGKVLLLIKFV